MAATGTNENDTPGANGGNGHDEARKPQVFSADFETLFKLKEEPDRRGIIYLFPEEIGASPDELGAATGRKMQTGDRIGFTIGPLKGGALSEIVELVKDFEGAERQDQYNREIILRGVLNPKIPDDARGRRYLDRWLSGTRENVARAILEQTGLGLREVKNARDELGNLIALTPSTP